MAKGELNNLLSFKDFSGGLPTNNQKKTKRTDVGLDILNENFYDKLVFKVKNDRPLEATITELEKLLLKSIKSGTVDEYEKVGDDHTFTLRGRNFKIKSDGSASIRTPRNLRTEVDPESGDKTHTKDWVNFQVPAETAENIIDALEDLDYL